MVWLCRGNASLGVTQKPVQSPTLNRRHLAKLSTRQPENQVKSMVAWAGVDGTGASSVALLAK